MHRKDFTHQNLSSIRASSISPLGKVCNKIPIALNSALPEQLIQQIREQGPLPFYDFMDQALYHPQHGFYSSRATRTGRAGDFLTPVALGNVLGQLLALQANQLFEGLGRPPAIQLVEQGADTGRLACDLLSSIHQNHPLLAASAQFHFLEPLAILREKQKHTLSSAGLLEKVQWHDSWKEMPQNDIPCFFYSCELIDSFPVRIFRYRDGAWREQWVGLGDAGFIWMEGEIDADTTAQIRLWSPPEVDGFTVEMRPGAIPWLQSWARRISQGLVLTLDYGCSATELFSPAKAGGTLVAMRDHQRSTHPLAEPGQQDLTTHVNFTELEESAAREGWKNYGLVNFTRGCTALAAPLLQEDKRPSDTWIRNFRHLTHPTFFGHTHKILVQGKGLPETFQPAMLRTI